MYVAGAGPGSRGVDTAPCYVENDDTVSDKAMPRPRGYRLTKTTHIRRRFKGAGGPLLRRSAPARNKLAHGAGPADSGLNNVMEVHFLWVYLTIPNSPGPARLRHSPRHVHMCMSPATSAARSTAVRS